MAKVNAKVKARDQMPKLKALAMAWEAVERTPVMKLVEAMPGTQLGTAGLLTALEHLPL